MAGGTDAAPGTPGTRGGRARPPVVNTRAIADFDEITAIPFTFARRPMYPEAHLHMNSIYADAFLDIDDLFVGATPPTRANFFTDPVAVIKNKIRDESIAPNVADTPDLTASNPLWARCSFLISVGTQCITRQLTPATLKEALQHAIGYANLHELKITIGIQALHFRPDLSYLEWRNGIADSVAGFAAETEADSCGFPSVAFPYPCLSLAGGL